MNFDLLSYYINLTKLKIFYQEFGLNIGSLGIALTFLKLDSWSLGAGFSSVKAPEGINQIKKEKL